jgi:hypothetical protein
MVATRFRTSGQVFALVFGTVYLLVGLLAFTVTGFASLTREADTFLIFPVNPLHNLIHVVFGGAWVASSATPGAARVTNLLLGGVYGLVTVLGLLGLLEFLNIEDLGSPDNFLHLATGGLALYFGAAGAEERAQAV